MTYGYLDEELNEHNAKMKAMRERQKSDQKAMVEEHKAAMQAMKEEMNALIKMDEEEISAAIQAFEIKVAARRLYHEAPDDVFELFVKKFSDFINGGYGRGDLNVLRLVSKRCLRLVESVATRLTSEGDFEALPVAVLKRCKRIEHIACYGGFRSLEGCPVGLKSLYIDDGSSLEGLEPLSACKGLKTLFIRFASRISDLSPLSSCTNLKKMILERSKVIDLGPLSSMTLLEELDLSRNRAGISIKDLSCLPHCLKLQKLRIGGYMGIEDLSPLSECPDLEDLNIYGLPLIEDLSFFEKGFAKLRVLNINHLQVDDLSPLINLQNLEELYCFDIPRTTTLLSLARCHKLKRLICSSFQNELDELRKRRPDIAIL